MTMGKGLLITILFILGFLFLSDPSRATDWVLVGKSEDGNMSAFIDKESISQTSGDIIKCRQKFSYVKPIFLNNPRKPVKTLIAYREWDCSGEKYNDLQVTFCYSDGAKETETYEYALWHYFKQGTLESDLYDYVCNQE
jgi:hypothetical protein